VSRQKIVLALVALVLMGGAAGLLVRMKSRQHLGQPGVKTEAIPGSRNLRVLLPEWVLTYDSQEIPLDAIVTNVLPADTSYGQRVYVNTGNSNEWFQMSVVLMGSDRTSIHKPQYCLEGAGWRIEHPATAELKIPMTRPQPYDLPVIKILATREHRTAKGTVPIRGLYVYWFVADDALSGDKSGAERMWWMAKHLLKTGELQRWAYVSCFAVCLPGEEAATFERMKKFLAAAVPQFQLVPRPGATAAAGPP
jgi:hypothetical protein